MQEVTRQKLNLVFIKDKTTLLTLHCQPEKHAFVNLGHSVGVFKNLITCHTVMKQIPLTGERTSSM